MKPHPGRFQADLRASLENQGQRRNLAGAMRTIRNRRNERFSELPDGEALRALGQGIKRRALAQLPQLLEQLEERLSARGIQVHWAETVEEANRIVLDIARRREVKLVVKGKSMVSEEMGLNAFLASEGIEALEADLGEFIVQLAGQTPSHIVVPAVHMSRQEIARLFHEKLRTPYTEDVAELTALARQVLREKFQAAGMGITGVNFAVAETGTLALVENEGNGRMVTTVPPVHVALMGLEKVVPTLADVPPLMRLLTRSATGQAITTYFNWISSPRREGEVDGPEEVHLILLDNGRSAIHGDETRRDTLDCIRCGACLNICPVYERVGGHAYHSVYMGPIGKVLTPQMEGLAAGGHLCTASTLCGACQEVCPVRIPIPDLLLRLRAEGVGGRHAPLEGTAPPGRGSRRHLSEAWLWKGWRLVHGHPALYRRLTGLAWLGGLASGPLARLLPPLRAWGQHRTLPRPARQTLHALLAARGTTGQNPGGGEGETP